MAVTNLLTFDVEEWFRANYSSLRDFEEPENDARIEPNVERILNLCARHQATATFFILGQTAERFPGLVRKIRECGHEIASHGHAHALIYNQPPQAFAADLKKSLAGLEAIIQERILGYRAPSWSAYSHWDWFFEILQRNGLVYDSSLFPAKTFLYGDRRAERFPHQIKGLIEIPASTLMLAGRRIPFSSGFFFRLCPSGLIRHGIRSLNRLGLPAMVCLHPREIDTASPRLKLPPRERFIHYTGIRNAEHKLDRLLSSFHFCSIRDYLGL
ncbi:MAG: polysaccharide deacetylase family protein [Acidobacteriota bacterium]